MNEQAKLRIERIWPQCVSELTMDTGEVIKNSFDKYKFAELIVQECLTKCWYDSTPKQIADNIKQHFGIEE